MEVETILPLKKLRIDSEVSQNNYSKYVSILEISSVEYIVFDKIRHPYTSIFWVINGSIGI